ncbi:CHAT domain-containing protein [Echria macrotheca]|uniref:CHAT domain-containing protein n=1 Tax=Echria macrotheca TaxID=438768 RepID=A0AAJ0BKC1_9PEZI|nr:CHAT domain-containing protein [Echria macrotheca]
MEQDLSDLYGQAWAVRNNFIIKPLTIYTMARVEHRFAVKKRCDPDPRTRSVARSGLRNIQEAYQTFIGNLTMEAECHFFWAELILDQADSEEHLRSLVPSAVLHYVAAQDLLDLIRQGIGQSPVRFGDWTAKRTFHDDEDKGLTPNNAITWLTQTDNLPDAWEWIQRWKAASLAETVGLQSRSLSGKRLLATARAADPVGHGMLEELDRLSEDLVRGRGAGYVSLAEKQAAYNRLLSRLRQRRSLRPILSLRGQLPLLKADYDDMVVFGRPDGPVTVDWVHLGRELVVFISRPRGRIDYVDLGGYDAAVRGLAACFDTPDLDTLPSHEMFGQFDALIAPLRHYTDPGEVLILSPTEDLHRLPLHALMLDGEPLIARNPVVYSYSASLMAACAMRREASAGYTLGKVVVVGNPKNDSTLPIPGVRGMSIGASMDASCRAVAMQLRAGSDFISPIGGITKAQFSEAVSNAGILHYHGHAKHATPFARETGLMLAKGDIFEPEDMCGLTLQEGAHVTLIACNSGKQDVSFGNEPLGMAPALFIAGASSVLATLWPIPSSAGQAFSESFYRDGLGIGSRGAGVGVGRVNLARATQRAVLYVRGREGGGNSSHWASFVLRGFPEIPET